MCKFYNNKKDENQKRYILYLQYLLYLKDWIKTHSSKEFVGMSPVCFEEYLDNEYEEEEDE